MTSVGEKNTPSLFESNCDVSYKLSSVLLSTDNVEPVGIQFFSILTFEFVLLSQKNLY